LSKITNIPDFSLHSGNCFSIQPEYTTILSKFITEKKENCQSCTLSLYQWR